MTKMMLVTVKEHLYNYQKVKSFYNSVRDATDVEERVYNENFNKITTDNKHHLFQNCLIS